ncbi:MAG: peptidoglycan bridge formation glycyltransferase FemA/FemB family protein [Bacteroidales bacterium]|nr:peptidoglycan bridge formation glycyltransferase FemA/FemB family protein [Bacteroidales bacterium]
MITDIWQKDVEELYPSPIVQQTAFWSKLKQKSGLKTLAIDFKSQTDRLFDQVNNRRTIQSDLLVIVQPVNNNFCIAYAPYGPELEPEEEKQGMFLEALSENLKPHLPANCIAIRYDLQWESYWAKDTSYFDAEGNWLGEPSSQTQEFRFNYNTQNWNFEKSRTNILPSHTFFINLKLSDELLLQKMKPKTRYNIKLAQRKGVSVRTLDTDQLHIWYKLYQETAERNRFHVNDLNYFETVLSTKANDTYSPAEVFLLVAEWNSEPLAAMFLIISGKRSSYLYGASTAKHRNVMATYALQWEAIQLAKAKGCTEYDMFGTSPTPDPTHPMYGLYKFKSGFGGSLFHGLGCWDYPLLQKPYDMYKAIESQAAGFHMS